MAEPPAVQDLWQMNGLLAHRLQNITDYYAQVNKEREEHNAKVAGLEAQLLESRDAGEKLLAAGTRLTEQKAELVREKEGLQEENQRLQKEKGDLEAENETFTREKNDLQKKNKSLQKEKETLQREKESLETENAGLKTNTVKCAERIKSLEERANEDAEKIAELQKALDAANIRMDNAAAIFWKMFNWDLFSGLEKAGAAVAAFRPPEVIKDETKDQRASPNSQIECSSTSASSTLSEENGVSPNSQKVGSSSVASALSELLDHSYSAAKDDQMTSIPDANDSIVSPEADNIQDPDIIENDIHQPADIPEQQLVPTPQAEAAIASPGADGNEQLDQTEKNDYQSTILPNEQLAPTPPVEAAISPGVNENALPYQTEKAEMETMPTPSDIKLTPKPLKSCLKRALPRDSSTREPTPKQASRQDEASKTPKQQYRSKFVSMPEDEFFGRWAAEIRTLNVSITDKTLRGMSDSARIGYVEELFSCKDCDKKKKALEKFERHYLERAIVSGHPKAYDFDGYKIADKDQ